MPGPQATSDTVAPWTMGAGALMRNLAKRGLLPEEFAGRRSLRAAMWMDANPERIPSAPYPGGCDRIEGAYQKLVGANLARGFRRVVKEALGGVHGCSHLTELVGLLPSVAVQTFASLRREIEGAEKPFQLDRCHALDRPWKGLS